MKKISGFILVLIFLMGCKPDENFSPVPAITFKSIDQYTNSNFEVDRVDVTISFTDGDGDIGYKDAGQNDPIFDDSSSQYYYNFNIKMQELINGVWITNPAVLSGRIPYLTPEGNNKNLEGQITQKISAFPINVVDDTVRYEIFIYDRSLNQSNTIVTDAIIINS